MQVRDNGHETSRRRYNFGVRIEEYLMVRKTGEQVSVRLSRTQLWRNPLRKECPRCVYQIQLPLSANSGHPQDKHTCLKAAVRDIERLQRVACGMPVMREIHSGRFWSFKRLLAACSLRSTVIGFPSSLGSQRVIVSLFLQSTLTETGRLP